MSGHSFHICIKFNIQLEACFAKDLLELHTRDVHTVTRLVTICFNLSMRQNCSVFPWCFLVPCDLLPTQKKILCYYKEPTLL